MKTPSGFAVRPNPFSNNRAQFHRAAPPTDTDIERLLDTLIGRITRALVYAGVLVEDENQPWRFIGLLKFLLVPRIRMVFSGVASGSCVYVAMS